LAENEQVDRLVTGHLYGGDRETRLVQEMMLGIGGVRLLEKLGIIPAVFHLNEGHSAFLTLELTRLMIETEGLNFAEAAKRVRERCVFTTHTPVAAGHDEFEASLVKKDFGDWPAAALGLSHEEFLKLGRVNGDSQESFGLTPLALRMCRSTNGVSVKHGEVSRELWHKMWPAKALTEDSHHLGHERSSSGDLGRAGSAPAVRARRGRRLDWRDAATRESGPMASKRLLMKSCGALMGSLNNVSSLLSATIVLTRVWLGVTARSTSKRRAQCSTPTS
jgi:hypothetical protein